MATWDEVRRRALALPEVTEQAGRRGAAWQVKGRTFVWERPLGRADARSLGDQAPAGPVLAAYVPDLGVKEALIADDPASYFTVPHFDGYPAVLVRLEVLAGPDLQELTVEAWLARAPARLVRAYLAEE